MGTRELGRRAAESMVVMNCSVRSVSVGAGAAIVAASFGTPLHHVERAPCAATAGALEHVSVDHRRLHVRVAEELLDRPDVVAVLDQVRREGVPEGEYGVNAECLRCLRDLGEGKLGILVILSEAKDLLIRRGQILRRFLLRAARFGGRVAPQNDSETS